jgi:hypothetical protein
VESSVGQFFFHTFRNKIPVIWHFQ